MSSFYKEANKEDLDAITLYRNKISSYEASLGEISRNKCPDANVISSVVGMIAKNKDKLRAVVDKYLADFPLEIISNNAYKWSWYTITYKNLFCIDISDNITEEHKKLMVDAGYTEIK